jgi:hypothetical protein
MVEEVDLYSQFLIYRVGGAKKMDYMTLLFNTSIYSRCRAWSGVVVKALRY